VRKFRGKTYTDEQLARAANSIGYLVWPKILDNRVYEDADIREFLENGVSKKPLDVEYARNLSEMRSGILQSIERLKARHISRIRVGVSWAEGEGGGGWEWIRWYLQKFHEEGFDILPCLNYTPHHYAEARIEKLKRGAAHDPARLGEVSEWRPLTNTPPEPIEAFGQFVERFLKIAGDFIGEYIELWNEPNLDTDWDPMIDPDGILFVQMIAPAAHAAHARGRKVLLGGLTKLVPSIAWLEKTCPLGLLNHVDAIGFHGLRGTWSDKGQKPWNERIAALKATLAQYTDRNIPIHVTEMGFSTLDLKLEVSDEEMEEIQAALFADLMLAMADGIIENAYWYAEKDHITDSVRKITTGWEDPLQHFFGDTDMEGNPKLLRVLLEEGGPLRVLEHVEQNKLWNLADKIIDRGTPADWPGDKLEAVVEEMVRRAKERTDEFKQERKEAA
jgi:hypothetical protein